MNRQFLHLHTLSYLFPTFIMAMYSIDFPCDINGSWISVAGGVRLDINIINGKALEIKMEELSPEGKTPGFLKKGNWSLTGSLPLPQTSFIMLTGSNAQEKQVATFIGKYYKNSC